MKNFAIGATGFTLATIPFNQSVFENICQAVVVLATIYFQFKNRKK